MNQEYRNKEINFLSQSIKEMEAYHEAFMTENGRLSPPTLDFLLEAYKRRSNLEETLNSEELRKNLAKGREK